jgi:hypothetical protein
MRGLKLGNDSCSLGHTNLVQPFADRWSLHRRKGAARHIIDMVLTISLAYPSGEVGFFFSSNDFYLPSRLLEKGGSQHPVV